MKVALTHPYCWPYVRRGTERNMDVWSRYLSGRGYQVSVVSTAPEPGDAVSENIRHVLYPQVQSSLLERMGITPLHTFFSVVRDAIPKINPDLVHSYHFYDTLAATMPARRPYRVVMQMNGVPVPGVSCRRFLPPEASLIRRAMRRADVRITCSEFVRQMIQEHYGQDALVLAPPLDEALWPMGVEPRADPPAVLMVANFNDRRKGLRVMLQGFSILQAAIPELQLWLSGAMSPELERAVVDALPEKVRRSISVLGLGKPGELAAIYQKASVLALPSMWEPSGTVMMESWLCGTPVVATRHGGLPEYFGEGVGFLFDPGAEGEEAVNAEGLAEAIGQALKLGRDERARPQCRQHGERFTARQLGPRYEEIYSELCK